MATRVAMATRVTVWLFLEPALACASGPQQRAVREEQKPDDEGDSREDDDERRDRLDDADQGAFLGIHPPELTPARQKRLEASLAA
jgi:hypothetical protein